MKRIIVVCASLGLCAVAWHAGSRALSAQGRKPVQVTRIYATPDGQSHLEEIEMKLNGNASEMMKATGVQFSSRPAGTQDWHNAPRRQFVITLSGRGEVETSDGKKVQVGPGAIDLVEDTTGKGHITRDFGPDGRVTVTVPIGDQPVALVSGRQ